MQRVALVLVASLLPHVAWASCVGLTGQDQVDCVDRRLDDAIRIIGNLRDQLATTQTELAQAQGDLADAEARLAAVESDAGRWESTADTVDDWSTYLSMDPATDSVVFTGANVFVQSGSGATDGAVNGTGNLIVGYGEGTGARGGSHNVVVGRNHAYSSYGGLVAGYDNDVASPYASVVGGAGNTASAPNAAVLGGQNNTADGAYASVAGGYSNVSGGTYSVAVGGYDNAVYESDSVLVGGTYNTVVDGDSGYSNVLVGGFQATLDGGLFYSVMSYGNAATMTTSGHFY